MSPMPKTAKAGHAKVVRTKAMVNSLHAGFISSLRRLFAIIRSRARACSRRWRRRMIGGPAHLADEEKKAREDSGQKQNPDSPKHISIEPMDHMSSFKDRLEGRASHKPAEANHRTNKPSRGGLREW